MNKAKKILLEPIRIGNLNVKNRVAMAPMNMSYTAPEHYPSKQQAAYYAARAAGGTGLIIVEAMMGAALEITDTYRKYNNISIANEKYLPHVAEFVEHIKSFGAKIIGQLSIGPGRQGTSELGAVQPVAASAIPYEVLPNKLINGLGSATNLKPMIAMARALGYHGQISKNPVKAFEQIKNIPGMHVRGEVPREITKVEIKQLIDAYSNSAKCVKLAGFDGIEIHAPHGYLLHSFISPRLNKRLDEYGGSMENNLRIIKESIEAMREKVGSNYTIGIRISASEDIKEGMTPKYVNEVAKLLEGYGVNFIHLSDGTYECMSDFLPNNDGQVVDKASIIKKGLNIPLICPSIHDPKLAEKVINKGYADMISQGRQQIADPDWVNKYANDRESEIIRCIRCNEGCIKRFMVGLPVRCHLNPIVGHEEHIDKYTKRSLESLHERHWQFISEIGKEPSSYIAN